MIHKSINFSRRPYSPDTLADPHLEELTYSQAENHRLDHYQRLHTPRKLLHRRIQSISGSSVDDDGHPHTGRLQRSPLIVVFKLYNTMLESMVSGSNFGILNWDSPTRLPDNTNPNSPDVSLASASLITSTNWHTKTNLGSDHLPILISLQMDVTITPIQHRTSIIMKKANWDRNSREIEDKLSKRWLPTDCQKGEKILRVIILKAASHHIPSGRHRINTELVSTEILEKMRVRDDLRSRDPTSPALPEMNDEITRTTNEHDRQKWRQFVETLDHKTDSTKLWRTIKAIDGRSTPKAENEAITFDGSQVTSPKQIANYFNRQFTTSKLVRHTSSRDTRLVSREIKRKSLTSAVPFTADQVTKGISSCATHEPSDRTSSASST